MLYQEFTEDLLVGTHYILRNPYPIILYSAGLIHTY
ncbi:hypothetical protein FKM82_004530 [Ascaphus truei]